MILTVECTHSTPKLFFKCKINLFVWRFGASLLHQNTPIQMYKQYTKATSLRNTIIIFYVTRKICDVTINTYVTQWWRDVNIQTTSFVIKNIIFTSLRVVNSRIYMVWKDTSITKWQLLIMYTLLWFGKKQASQSDNY